MKSFVAVVLTMSVAVAPLSVIAQEQGSDEWSKIRALEAGTEVVVRTAGSAPRIRYFVAADNEMVTLLNVVDPSLPPDVAKLLRRATVEHPRYFGASQSPGATFVLDKQVVLRSTGLFVAHQKVADYNQIIEQVARADVENGVVLMGKAPMETSTKVLLGVVIPVVAIWVFTIIMGHLAR